MLNKRPAKLKSVRESTVPDKRVADSQLQLLYANSEDWSDCKSDNINQWPFDQYDLNVWIHKIMYLVFRLHR